MNTMNQERTEKLDLLRQAASGSGPATDPADDLQMMFDGLIDRLTPWQIRLLALFDDPESWLKERDIDASRYARGSSAQLLEDTFPQMEGRREFYDLIVRDLYNAGLFLVDSLHVSVSPKGALAQRTSSLGRKFLEFLR